MHEESKRSKEVFISYQTADKVVAGKIKEILSDYGMDSFLAHEDI
jgi:adenine-specific DNA methylase